MSKLIRTIIIDDESLARVNIRSALADYPHWQISAELSDGRTLRQQLQRTPADIIFLDIQMPGIDGLTLARQLSTDQNCPLIIFVTAYDQYAIDAFELHALDYLLKPFDDERFQRCVQRAEHTFQQGLYKSLLNNWRQSHSHNDTPKPLQQLVIRSVGNIRLIPVAEVRWFGASGNYVAVHHSEGMHLHRVSLSYLEQQLDSAQFCRVHRSAIVKLSEVREINSLTADQHHIVLSDGSTVKISDRYKENLLQFLGIKN